MVYKRRVPRDSYGLRAAFGFPLLEETRSYPPVLNSPPHMAGTGPVPGGLINMMHRHGSKFNIFFVLFAIR
jgi:hypothetical protein